jgi:hypothetical protein
MEPLRVCDTCFDLSATTESTRTMSLAAPEHATESDRKDAWRVARSWEIEMMQQVVDRNIACHKETQPQRDDADRQHQQQCTEAQRQRRCAATLERQAQGQAEAERRAGAGAGPPPEPGPELELEPEPEPSGVSGPVAEPPDTIRGWLESVKLGACLAPLRALGYEEDVDMLVDGDAEEVRDILAAVEEAAEVKKPTTKKFKRELARLRGQGEAFA